QVSNDVEALSPGTGCYAAFLTPKGKMLGDVRILDAGDEILLDTERVALQELFNMVRRFSVGYAVELHKRTLERGLLSLLGPGAQQREQPALKRALVQLHGVADAEAAHHVEQLLEGDALSVQEDLVAGVENTDIAEHLALGGEERRVAAGSRRERLDVV